MAAGLGPDSTHTVRPPTTKWSDVVPIRRRRSLATGDNQTGDGNSVSKIGWSSTPGGNGQASPVKSAITSEQSLLEKWQFDPASRLPGPPNVNFELVAVCRGREVSEADPTLEDRAVVAGSDGSRRIAGPKAIPVTRDFAAFESECRQLLEGGALPHALQGRSPDKVVFPRDGEVEPGLDGVGSGVKVLAG